MLLIVSTINIHKDFNKLLEKVVLVKKLLLKWDNQERLEFRIIIFLKIKLKEIKVLIIKVILLLFIMLSLDS